ncbi:hypothetical protein CYMTET_32514 [Cymbomonas tetramitiformis]|uniref:PEP-utilising enzyme C-terminal domain-containing protein n=1 Tax=Cymbomonas tetramitiformis TaxID=36881 RepID=A0AAE0FEK4_9CHLO|nr:hypothetical protein CYMTET_32514 [Cymbomonas tetramitiformis]
MGMSRKTRTEIQHRTAGYSSAREFYVQKLAEGISMIAAAFYPKPVIVRMSDFKSNEYAHLVGGEAYEPKEENPMLGFRGACRYYSPSFQASFQLECEAVLQVRERMGLTNVQVMLPFVRTVKEVELCTAEMNKHGLSRSEDGTLNVYIMCEIPANALLADEFLQHCDGFSIGSNDLLQLTLGVDRDSGLLADYDERNPAVLELIRMAITAANKQGKYVGICGQAPSDFPEITRILIIINRGGGRRGGEAASPSYWRFPVIGHHRIEYVVEDRGVGVLLGRRGGDDDVPGQVGGVWGPPVALAAAPCMSSMWGRFAAGGARAEAGRPIKAE